MWKESYYDKLQVSQASWRLFQCPRKILCRFQLREVRSQVTIRTMWCSRPDALQLATSVRTPRSVLQINIEDVGMSEQHRLDARSISIQQGVCFQKSTLFGKSLQAFQTTWQHVRTMSSSSEYCRVPFDRGRDFSEDRPDARLSHPDVNPIKMKLRCFWKDIVENRQDVANFHPDARQPESESQQFLRSLEAYK
jgi:hypothetical protein